jgi:hypothetical protein
MLELEGARVLFARLLMKPFDAALAKMRKICLSLPARRTPPGAAALSRRREDSRASEKGVLIMVRWSWTMPMRWSAGGLRGRRTLGTVVSADVGVKDWDELGALIHESYRLIAPKKTLAKWQGGPAGGVPAAPARKARKTSRRASSPKKKKRA